MKKKLIIIGSILLALIVACGITLYIMYQNPVVDFGVENTVFEDTSNYLYSPCISSSSYFNMGCTEKFTQMSHDYTDTMYKVRIDYTHKYTKGMKIDFWMEETADKKTHIYFFGEGTLPDGTVEKVNDDVVLDERFVGFTEKAKNILVDRHNGYVK